MQGADTNPQHMRPTFPQQSASSGKKKFKVYLLVEFSFSLSAFRILIKYLHEQLVLQTCYKTNSCKAFSNRIMHTKAENKEIVFFTNNNREINCMEKHNKHQHTCSGVFS